MPEQPFTGLPLRSLLVRLRQEGFALTPDRLVRIELALANKGMVPSADSLKDLRYFLAPLIASDGPSQEKFYVLFDEWARAFEPKETPVTEQPKQHENPVDHAQKIWKRFAWVTVGVALAALLVWLVVPPSKPIKPDASFSIEMACVQVGDSVHLTLLSPDTALPRLWLFGDGTQDSLSLNPVHRYADTGKFVVRLILGTEEMADTAEQDVYVRAGGDPANANFEINNLGENRYRFEPEQLDSLRFEYRWDFGGNAGLELASIAQPEVILPEGKDHYITLTVHLRAAGSLPLCDATTTQKLDLKKELVPLPTMQPARLESTPTYRWTWLAWLLPLLLGVLGILTWLSVLAFRRRPTGSEGLRRAFEDGGGPPVRLPFPESPDTNEPEEAFRTLTEGLRQRLETEVALLDLPATLRATIRQGGLPDFRYRKPDKAAEYLALVQTRGEDDQQARLFTRFLHRMQAEQVSLDIFYFRDDIRSCFRGPASDTVPLHRLQEVYSNHRLLVYGEAKALLNPYTNELMPGLEKTLGAWEQKAWFTPLPPADWGSAERTAGREFVLLPADLDGQNQLLEVWEERRDLDFRSLQRQFMKQGRFEALSDYDFRNAKDLQGWLGIERFQWLAAAALYPRPEWEVILAMGHAISPGAVSFDDLLRLTRIPWLQTGDLSETLRAELVALLTPQNERIARATLLALLEQTSPPPESFAAQEKAIQLAVQEALLYPEDEGRQSSLRLLWEQGLLDPLHRGIVRQEADARQARNRRQLFTGTGIVLLVALLCSLGVRWVTPPEEPVWQQAAMVEALPADSAAWYVNAAADSLAHEDTTNVSRLLDRALALQPNLPEARYNRIAYHYLRGRLAYQQRNFARAEALFDSAATAATDGLGLNLPGYEPLPGGRDASNPDATYLLLQHSLHGLGLSRYYAGNRASAVAIRDQMDSTYFTRYHPNLLTLLGGDALRRQVAQALAQADSLWDTLRPGLENADAIEIDAALIVLRQAYEGVQALDPANARAAARLAALEELRRKLLPVYDLRGTVVDDSTGLPLRGVQVGWWEGTARTDAKGVFSATVQEEARGDGQIALALQLSGYENLYVTVALPPAAQRLRMKRVPKGPDLNQLRQALDLALKQSRCAKADSLLDLLDAANVPDIYSYRQQREEVCGGQKPADLRLPDMVLVRGGKFTMGSKDGEDDEKPPHDVTVSDFYLGKYEVTNAQYAAFLNAYGSDQVKTGEFEGQSMIYTHQWGIQKNDDRWAPTSGYENQPVVPVTWYGASEYCNWLSVQTGQKWRLPTEAEWEYAAGGGVNNRTRFAGTDVEKDLGAFAWYNNNSGNQTHAVGGKRPNTLGLYDMSGNVWEWCLDWYGGDYSQNSDLQNPKGPKIGTNRVLHGGSWYDDESSCRVSDRLMNYPGSRFDNNGFRIARELP